MKVLDLQDILMMILLLNLYEEEVEGATVDAWQAFLAATDAPKPDFDFSHDEAVAVARQGYWLMWGREASGAVASLEFGGGVHLMYGRHPLQDYIQNVMAQVNAMKEQGGD